MITPEHEKARRLEAIKRHLGEGGSIASAARELGCKPGTLSEWTRSSLGVNNSRDLAVQTAMDAVGTGLVPHSMWTKVPPKDGEPGFSVYHKIEQTPEDVAERIRAALEGLTPAEPVIPPASVAADLCNVFPLFDVHFGMRAWGMETRGPDYDLRLAAEDLKAAFEAVVQLAPQAQEAILIVGGDFFHADDNRAETPANRHKLDVDGRYGKVIDEAVEVMGYVIDRIAARHAYLTICVIRGNHDEHSHVALRVGLRQRYRTDPRITVQTSHDGLFMRQWGKAAIFAHHGDKAPPERQCLYLSDVCPFWSDTRHRHYYTGHTHKDMARDIGPVKWESLRAFCPPDAYASGMGYASRRALKADVYHKVKGRIGSWFDPIER
jgi:hypothetical protein